MSHYAFLDENNIVVNVIVGKSEDELDQEGNPVNWEKYYGDFHNLKCKRTSYNTYQNKHNNGGVPYRGNYAGIGYYYDEDWDVFIPPKPYDSWKLDYETYSWIPPIPEPAPEEGYYFKWSEINQEWIKVNLQ